MAALDRTSVLAHLPAAAVAALRSADPITGALPRGTRPDAARALAHALGHTSHTPRPAALRAVRAAAAVLRCAERDGARHPVRIP